MFIWVSLGYTDGKVLVCYEGIKLVSTDGYVFGAIFLILDRITLGLDIGTDIGSLDGSFDGSNDVRLGVLFLEDSLGYIDGRVLGSDEGIKLIFTNVKVFTLVSNM